jgi:hypothetical protein
MEIPAKSFYQSNDKYSLNRTYYAPFHWRGALLADPQFVKHNLKPPPGRDWLQA